METAFNKITVESLVSAGAHFGHLTRRWHPNFKPFIYAAKNGIHIIDVQQTLERLRRATEALAKLVAGGGTVLFVGTKKQAKDVLQREADRCGMYYVVERWLGGTLTNFSTIKRSIKRLQQLEKDADTLYESMTKKEILKMERERIRLSDQHRGIKDMKQLPNAIFVVDINFELTAVLEAKRLEIPVFAIVDSNTDPTTVDYPIPANDDSLRAIQLITAALADGIIAARGGQSFEADQAPGTEAPAAETPPAAAPEAKAAATPAEQAPEAKAGNAAETAAAPVVAEAVEATDSPGEAEQPA